jgi:protocatechuate 3,4-dioxygenase, beta subunit
MTYSSGRRGFVKTLFAASAFGLAYPSVFRSQVDPTHPPPPPPTDTTSVGKIVPDKEPGDRLTVSGMVFAPDGRDVVPGLFVYAYNTDARGRYAADGKIYPPRLYGYMKTDANGTFELQTILPGRYPGMRVPAHIHFNLWGAGFPVQWTDDMRFEGDSYLTEEMRRDSAAKGKFAMIRPLTKDKTGLLYTHVNLQLREGSNFV